ncbi:MAG: DUF1559 domain-containing protein [Capsulimonadaceae bacterium]|nr:DUF1559 domain-containing protein [Capsulimonadaceae bacterium]
MTTTRQTLYKRLGFTLIELLIVIAIIAIIAAILFPVFATAREKARQTACASNLKQIGLAIVQYEQDYDETTPAGGDWHDNGCGWAAQIYPYVKTSAVFLCPDDTGKALSVCSYGYSSLFVTGLYQTTNEATLGAPAGWPLSQFTQPVRTVMIFEVTNNGSTTTSNVYNITGTQYVAGADIYPNSSGTVYFGGSPVGVGLGLGGLDPWGWNENKSAATGDQYATGLMRTDGWTNTNPLSAFSSLTGRHSLGSNFVMADGHVKWLMPEQVVGGRQHGVGYCSSTSNAWAYSPDCSAFTFAATFAIH